MLIARSLPRLRSFSMNCVAKGRYSTCGSSPIERFSAGAGAIAINYFCLFGFIFLITQYFQLIRGYSALSAGVHTLPFAAVVMVATPLGAVAALKFGARYVVSAGLLIVA